MLNGDADAENIVGFYRGKQQDRGVVKK